MFSEKGLKAALTQHNVCVPSPYVGYWAHLGAIPCTVASPMKFWKRSGGGFARIASSLIQIRAIRVLSSLLSVLWTVDSQKKLLRSENRFALICPLGGPEPMTGERAVLALQ